MGEANKRITQPDWHDAPTCAGMWACFEENGSRHVYKVSFPDASWRDGSRYFGPLPPDPKASDAT